VRIGSLVKIGEAEHFISVDLGLWSCYCGGVIVNSQAKFPSSPSYAHVFETYGIKDRTVRTAEEFGKWLVEQAAEKSLCAIAMPSHWEISQCLLKAPSAWESEGYKYTAYRHGPFRNLNYDHSGQTGTQMIAMMVVKEKIP